MVASGLFAFKSSNKYNFFFESLFTSVLWGEVRKLAKYIGRVVREARLRKGWGALLVSTSFWCDPWLEGDCLRYGFQRLFDLCVDKGIMVAEKRRLGWGCMGQCGSGEDVSLFGRRGSWVVEFLCYLTCFCRTML